MPVLGHFYLALTHAEFEKMNILFVCNEYPPTIHGGIGTFVYSLAHKLAQRGHSCFVIGYDQSVNTTTMRDEEGIHVTRLKSPFTAWPGIKFSRYQLNLNFILDRMYLSHQVNKLVKKEDITLVESYDWSGPLWNKPIVPLVVRMHGANSAYSKFEGKHTSKFLFFVERRNVLFADQLIAVSNHIGKLTLNALNIKNRTFEVIYNGVDTQMFLPSQHKREKDLILFAGSINRRKGIYEIFQAFNSVSKKKPAARLLIAGKLSSGIAGENLKNELLSLLDIEVRKRVNFLGHVPYHLMPEIYRKATIAIFPSHAEAFGLTCAEAMACETPVIMTKFASGPEIVEDKKSGMLIDATSPDDIAKAATFLLNHPSIRQDLGKNGRIRVISLFDQEMIVEQNIDLYQGLI